MSRRSQRGFTLLEVMVSLGILAVAMMAIADLEGGAVRMHAYSKRLTTAVQLARGKMLDIKQELTKEGVSDFSKEYRGDFSEEKEPDFKWVALVVKPEIELDASALAGTITSGLGIPMGEEGAAGGPETDPLSMLGPMAGMVDGQVKAMQETLKTSVREVRLSIIWKNGKKEESFEVVEHLVILPNARDLATTNATPVTPGLNPTALPGGVQPPGLGNKFNLNGELK